MNKIKHWIIEMLQILPPSALRYLCQLVAKHRTLSPWPGWVCDAITEDGHQLCASLRAEIVKRARKEQLDFLINCKFQPKVKVKIRLTEMMGRCLFQSGCYEPNEFAYLDRTLKRGMTFLDIGANFGLYTVWAARRVGNTGLVVAFEPSQREFIRLQKNVRLNHLKNVRLLDIGVSNSNRTAELHISDENEPGQNTLGGFVYPDVREVESTKIDLKPIDNILQSLRVKHVDTAKIDVEGHELFVLQGMRSVLERDHPSLIIEVQEASLQKQCCTVKQIFDLLYGIGYTAMEFDTSTGLPVPISNKESWQGNNLLWVAQ